MPFTTSEQVLALRQRARQLLQDGTLPPAPRLAFAGEHNGQPQSCALCALIIGRHQLAYQVQIEADGGAKRMLYLHPNCHAAWGAESPRPADESTS